MGSISSCHITPLVINSLGGRHTGIKLYKLAGYIYYFRILLLSPYFVAVINPYSFFKFTVFFVLILATSLMYSKQYENNNWVDTQLATFSLVWPRGQQLQRIVCRFWNIWIFCWFHHCFTKTSVIGQLLLLVSSLCTHWLIIGFGSICRIKFFTYDYDFHYATSFVY